VKQIEHEQECVQGESTHELRYRCQVRRTAGRSRDRRQPSGSTAERGRRNRETRLEADKAFQSYIHTTSTKVASQRVATLRDPMRAHLLLALVALVRGSDLHRYVQQDAFDTLEKELVYRPPNALNAIETETGQTPLMMAVLMGKTQAVKLLLKAGADTTIGEKDGYTPCHGAAFQGRPEVMKMLLEHGLPCTTDRHKDGYTPLHRACWGRAEGHTETVRVLLKAGAPADQMSDKGELPVDLTPNANTKKLIKHRLQKTAKVQISMDKDEM